MTPQEIKRIIDNPETIEEYSEIKRVIWMRAKKAHVADPAFGLDDLYQIGLITTWQILSTYDPKKGKFLAYLSRAVENNIRKHVFRNRSIYITRRRSDCVKAIVDQDITQESTAEEVREKLGITEEEYRDIYNATCIRSVEYLIEFEMLAGNVDNIYEGAIVKEIMAEMDILEKQIIFLRLQGYNMEQVSRILNKNSGTLYRVNKKIQDKIRAYYNRDFVAIPKYKKRRASA